jgi:hypothetical protein
MGNSKFFYYPMPNATHLQTIDLGEVVGELFSDFELDVVDADRRSGGFSRSVGMSREIVTIQRDRMVGSEDLAIQFVALQNHLDRGGVVGFCADSDKAFAYPLSTRPNSGDQTVGCSPNPFTDRAGSITPTAGDYIVLETESPASLREQCKITVNGTTPTAGGTITVKDPIAFNYRRRTFLRHYRFWPLCLRRPASDVGRNIVTNERGFLFSLDIRLQVDLSALFAFHRSFDGIHRNPDTLPTATNTTPPFVGGYDPLPFDRLSDIEIDLIDSSNAEDEFDYASGGATITFGE